MKSLALLMTFFLGSSALAEQKCETLFDEVSPQKVVQELASLRVDIEKVVTENPSLASTLEKNYVRRYNEALNSQVNLSKLPQTIEKLRQAGQDKENKERARSENARKNERLYQWDKGVTIQSDANPEAALAVHPFLDEALVNFQDQTLRIDLNTGAVLNTYDGINGVFSPDGKMILTDIRLRPLIHAVNVIDTSTGKSIYTSPTSLHSPRFKFSPDGKKVIYALSPADTRMWNISTRRTKKLPLPLGSGMSEVAFSPNGKYVLIKDSKYAVLWELSTGARVQTYMSPKEETIYDARFSPDGSKVLISSDDLVIFDTETAEQLSVFSNKKEEYRRAVYSPDGNYLLTVSMDRKGGPHTAKLWDVRGDRPLLFKDFGRVMIDSFIDFNFNGTKVLLRTHMQTFQVWTIQ
jgi:WD40 repeat protein